jgi:hypothetical protein
MTSESDRPSERPPRRAARPDPITLALDVAVFAPIGVAAYLGEVGPDVVRTVVARGRAEVEARQEQVAGGLRHAKGAGEVAIAFGLPLLRRKVGERLAALRPAPEPPPAARPRPRPAQPRPARAPAATTNGHHGADPVESLDLTVEPDGAVGAVAPPSAEAAAEGRLAIPGYDALSASQVVERLAGLTGDELAAVRQYEAEHRRRRTILGKIEQLSA